MRFAFRLVLLGIAVAAVGVRGAGAQVVQLPSLQTFSYSGAISAPDAGSAFAAGRSGSQSGSRTSGWGPYAPRASGSTFGTSSMSVTARVIDLQALDEAILSANVPMAAKPLAARNVKPGRGTVSDYAGEGVGPNLDPGKWQRVLAGGQPTVPAHSQLAESDIRFYLKKGQEAEAAHRLMSARVYYRMAVEAMTPEMKTRYADILAKQAAEKEAKTAAAAAAASSRTSF